MRRRFFSCVFPLFYANIMSMKEDMTVTKKLDLERENLRLSGEVTSLNQQLISLNEKLLHSDKRVLDLEEENLCLSGEVTSLKQKVLHSDKRTLELEHENLYLKEQLECMKRKLFGRSSERTLKDLCDEYYAPTLFDLLERFKEGKRLTEEDFNQLLRGKKEETDEKDENKDEEEDSVTIKEHKRKKNKKGEHALKYPEDLPVETTEIDLPENEKICPETGVALVRIGEVVSEKLAIKPSYYFLKRTIRFKYAYPKSSEQEGVKVPALPNSFLPHCKVDATVIADILTKKFCDHLPLHRIAEIYARSDVHMSRQYMCQLLLRTCDNFRLLHEALKKEVLATGNIFVDETHVKMQVKGKGQTHRCTMWVYSGGKERNPPLCFYDFRTSRKHCHVFETLKDYQGVFHSDKYAAYETLSAKEGIIWCPCFAHIRRKFIEGKDWYPKQCKPIIEGINKLFELDGKAWDLSEEERLKIRQEEELPWADTVIDLVENESRKGYLPKSKYAQALFYTNGLVPHLKNYINYAHAHLDNNVAERLMRFVAVGRKNWLFVGSEAGGIACAIALSLTATCKGVGVNPQDYFNDIIPRIMSYPASRVHELLPHHWKKSREPP